jgi:chitinase
MSSEWKVNCSYKVGDLITYNHRSFKCRNTHTSQIDWFPSVYTLSLWLPTDGIVTPVVVPVKTPVTTPVKVPVVVPVKVPAAISTTSTLLAPYLYNWGFWNSSYKVKTCMDVINKCKGSAVTLAFVLAGSGDQISQDIYAFSDDITTFNAAGGKLIVSFGGAAGTYVESQLSSSAMISEVSKMIDSTKCYGLDFDIEGSILTDTVLNDKRAKIIAQIQAKYPKLYISFTLPADRSGLTDTGIALISNCITNGVRIDVVNIMSMDIGALDGKTWGEIAVAMCETTFGQLKSLYPNKSQVELYKMLGVTPMIGKNDDGSIFTVADASTLGAYAKQKNIGLVSFWAINRDQTGSGDLGLFSQQNKTDFEYFAAFKATLK